MKKIIFLVAFFTFSFGGLFDEALKAFNNGDYKTAVNLYQKACDCGDALGGCVVLGVMYADGQGVRQDLSKAKELFGKACDLGEQIGCETYKMLNEKGVR